MLGFACPTDTAVAAISAGHAALRIAVSTVVMLGALPTEITPQERLRICDDAIERIARELGGR
jgi:hypothetical protein